MSKTLLLLALAGALTAAPVNISETYQKTADKLIAAALADKEGLARLQYLCDRIGNRVSGSASLERAIE
jgi:hypothetical protein